MLGELVEDPEQMEGGGFETGLGLLPVRTVFGEEKCLQEVRGTIEGLSGIFSSLNGLTYAGYEIHMGLSGNKKAVISKGNVYGTYVHGIFDESGIVSAMVRSLTGKDYTEDTDTRSYKESNYELLADIFEKNMDTDLLKKIIEEGIG